MDVTAPEELANRVVLGPCPGCLNWQLDYAPTDFTSYEDCCDVIETALAEHLDECPHLQQALGPDWASSS